LSGPPARDDSRGSGRDSPGAVYPPILDILVILGPTGTGKSELAYELARRLNGEIVNCDALQVYRGFDAATAKPPDDHRRLVPHHAVDCVEPSEDFNLAAFVRMAEKAIAGIAERRRVPVVAGGTGMYLRGLVKGIVSSPPRDERLRSRIHAIGHRRGTAALHRWLRRLDPESAARLPASDGQRLARAIEFSLLSDGTWSERLHGQGSWERGADRYRALKIGLTMDRPRLYERLDQRVDRFFEAGLVEEVRQRLADGVPATANAFKAIGYREVLSALSEGRDPEGVRDQVKRSTRRFAKRQWTWFRREQNVTWLDAELGTASLVVQVEELWKEHRAATTDSRA
jgi:tRNA dimethylallyltransferase